MASPKTCTDASSPLPSHVLRHARIFVVACIGGVLLHELGHAAGGWLQGIAVVPTPARDYILRAQVGWQERTWIALGGVAATTFLVLGCTGWFLRQRAQAADYLLAGVLVPPFFYTVRFLLMGRGHDGVEWQAAQAAVGATPSGHLLDVVFACLVLAGAAVWLFRRRAGFGPMRLAKALGLMLSGGILLVILQVANNAAFDRLFAPTETLNQPSGLDVK